jgi:hypothetical protein
MQTWTPLGWASDHWTQLGILGAVLAFFSRIHTAANKILGYGDIIEGSQGTLNLMMSNHLPHLQTELEKANATLIGLREDNQGLRNDLRALLTKRD